MLVFAQEPLFASSTAPIDATSENLTLLREAASRPGVSSIGSAPYVEPSRAHASQNIARILDLAVQFRLHADFHLDYARPPAAKAGSESDRGTSANAEPMIWELLDRLKTWKGTGTICIGHATLLTAFFSDSTSPSQDQGQNQWERYLALTTSPALSHLRITLIALPPSDLYMMGCTLDVARLEEEHGIRAAMSVNNVGNAFGPRGCVDPLEGVVGLAAVVGGRGTVRRWESLVVSLILFIHGWRV